IQQSIDTVTTTTGENAVNVTTTAEKNADKKEKVKQQNVPKKTTSTKQKSPGQVLKDAKKNAKNNKTRGKKTGSKQNKRSKESILLAKIKGKKHLLDSSDSSYATEDSDDSFDEDFAILPSKDNLDDNDDKSWDPNNPLCVHCAQYPCEVDKWLRNIIENLLKDQEEIDFDNKVMEEKVQRQRRKAAHQMLTIAKFSKLNNANPPAPACCTALICETWPSPSGKYTDN
ncbi:MAG TPA: hypothetical protein VIQ31_12400, partial [Phormidium sp.]